MVEQPAVRYEERPVSLECRGQCRGQDAGGYSTRPAHDSPAQFGKERGTGRKVLWCPCCNHELIWEEKLKPETREEIKNWRPPNLNPQLMADWRRFIDLKCEYEVVLLKNVVPI